MKDIRLRRATRDDARFLFEIRNDPVTVHNSIVAEPVVWETHIAWLAKTLSNPKRELYIAENEEGERVGMVRLDLDSEEAEVSINVAPEFRGKGIGEKILVAGIDHFRQTHVNVPALKAIIKPHNTASKTIFSRCGFKFTATKTVQETEVEVWYLHLAEKLIG